MKRNIIIVIVFLIAGYLILNNAPASVPINSINNDKKDSLVKKIKSVSTQEAEELRGKESLSPDGNYKVILTNGEDDNITTSIVDLSGKIIVPPHYGNFRGWSPDSKKVVLFLSNGGRLIYYLDLSGNYYDSGLPKGTFGAAISPKNDSIVYSLTDNRSDESTLYIRNLTDNRDRKLFDGNGDMLAWIKWSPLGDKIIFKKSDRYLRPGKQSIWVIDADGNNPIEISSVDWVVPFYWSEDGKKINFISSGYLWEYEINNK